MYTLIDIKSLKCGSNVKKFNFIICSLVILSVFCSCIVPVKAADEYVTVNMPLSWTTDVWLDGNGQEYIDDVGSVTDYLSIIEGATYKVNLSADNTIQNGCAVFYYSSDKSFISASNLWINSTGAQSVDLVVPAGAAYFRLLSSLNINSDSQQNIVQLQITVLETYLEKHDVVAETLQDLTYKDDNQSITEDADRLTSEFENLHKNENYLLESSKGVLDDFFASFSWSDLDEFSSGFQFVGIWFSNFYNSHSAVAVCVGMSAGITLLFVLLRFRGH